MNAVGSAHEPAGPTIEGTPVSSPLVPRARRRRDRVLPILLVASLIVHALVFLPSLLPHASDKPSEQEIPVELVQEPPPPKPSAPKPPPASNPPAPKPPAKPPPRRPEAKKSQAPPKPPKPPEPKKPAEQKPEKQEDVAARMKKLLGPQSLDPVAMPGESATGTDLVSYTQLVMSKLTKAEDHEKFPGRSGFATVTFLLGDAGEVLKVDLIRPSGDPTLDTEAVAVVHRAAPYPPPPPGGQREYTITMESRPIF